MRRGMAQEPTDPPIGGIVPVGRVFISYVREDSSCIDWLQSTLEAASIPVWRDTEDLWPGEDWRTKIRQAITNDALVFVACFSRASVSRHKSYQNEELALAIEQFRLRRPGDPWFFPVRLDECDIPNYDIGGGRTLESIQHVDLFGDRSNEEVTRLISTIQRIPGWNPDTTAIQKRSRRPTIADIPWRIMAVLLAVVTLGIASFVASQILDGRGSRTVTGSVLCESGRPVVGVWIAASTGQVDSGFAHLGPPDVSGISSPIGATGTYSYRLPHGGSYAAHVGCGGTAQDWASANYSPLLSNPHVHLRCNDPISSASGATVRGQCIAAAVS